VREITPKEPNEIWDTLVYIFGEPMPSQNKLYGKITAELREAGATPTSMLQAATAMAIEWGRKTVTPTSLAKWHNRFTGAIAGISDDPSIAQMELRFAELKRTYEKGIPE
jgi:hypothetical protein